MSTKKNLTTKTTIDNLAAELKKSFAKKSELTPISTAAAAAIKSVNVSGNTVSFYTSTDKSGNAVATVDFPKELFLDQTKTEFVAKFKWAEATYPGSTNPNLDDKPVMVLAVKGTKGTEESISYSFLSMSALVDTYVAKTNGKDASTTIEISDYTVEVKVNISAESGNQLEMKDDGLYVPKPQETDISGKADKVSGATEGDIATLDANGNLTDSGKKPSAFVEKVLVDGVEDPVLHESDISDYTAEEIAALLADDDNT
jgi:hypothetical protein